jgi:uncharacterized protein (TIGR00266 family)
LNQGEQINTESGSMLGMTTGMDIKTRMNRSYDKKANIVVRFFSALWGFFVAMMRKIFGGESFFINTYTAKQDNSELILAPSVIGDIVHFPMSGQKMIIQASSFLASSPDVSLKLKWGGLRTLFGGEGLVMLQAAGQGDLFINSYGGVVPIDIQGAYIVDTGHVVAFEDSLSFKIKRVGGWKSTLFSGEGLVCHFSGTGKLFIQTRQLGSLVSWLSPMLH